MRTTAGRIRCGQRFWWFSGKKRYFFSVGLGLFWIEVERGNNAA